MDRYERAKWTLRIAMLTLVGQMIIVGVLVWRLL
jgi:hypothetical protein